MITVIVTVILVMTDQFVGPLCGDGLDHEHAEQEVDVGEGGHGVPGHWEGDSELHPGGLLLLQRRAESHSLQTPGGSKL